MASGGASAAWLAGKVSWAPSKDGKPFIGAAGTKVGAYNNANAAADGTAANLFTISYYPTKADAESGTNKIGADDDVTVSGTAKIATTTVGLHSGAKYVTIKVTTDANDTFANNNDFLTAAGSFKATQAAASTAGTTIAVPIDSSYTGFGLVKAQKNAAGTSSATQIYLTFNADPVDTLSTPGSIALVTSFGGAGSAAKLVKLVDSGGAQDTSALKSSPNGVLFVGGKKNIVKLVANSVFVKDIAKAISGDSAAKITDGANAYDANGTGISVDLTVPLNLASSTAKAVAVTTNGANAASLYNAKAGGTGLSATNVTIAIRFNQALSAAVAASKIDFVDSAGTSLVGSMLAEGAVQLNPNNSAVTEILLKSNAGKTLFVDSADGKLKVANRAGATLTQAEIDAAKTISIKLTATGGATSLVGSDVLDNDTTIASILTGAVPSQTYVAIDSDKNGVPDGAEIKFGATVSKGSSAGYALAVNGQQAGITSSSTAKDGVITTKAVTLSTDKKAVDVTFDEAGGFNWDDTGASANKIDAADTTKFKTFDTASTSKVAVKLTKASSDTKYTGIYDALTGELLVASTSDAYKVANVDGMSPVLVANPSTIDATHPATVSYAKKTDGTGVLTATFSENLSSVAGQQVEDFLIDGAPLTLLNLNLTSGSTQPSIDTTASSGKKIVIKNIAVNAIKPGTSKLTIATSPVPNASDASANKIASNSTGVTIADGGAAVAAPKMLKAFTVLNQQGEVSNLIVVYDREVALAKGATSEGIFKVNLKGIGTNPDVTVTIPKDKVVIDSTNKKKVTLTLPINVKKGVFGDAIIEYDPNGTNKLVSTDTKPVDVFNSSSFSGTNDGDTQTTQLSKNSTQLFVMELKGSVTDGGKAVPEGTIVRLDLISETTLGIAGATSVVPCAKCGRPTVALTVTSSVENAISAARAKGERTIHAFIRNNKDANGVWTVATIDTSSSGGGEVSPVTVDVITGRIIGATTGQIAFAKTNHFNDIDTTYVVMDGKNNGIRVSVGSEKRLDKGFVMISAQKPGQSFMLLNTTVPQLQGFIPFTAELSTKGKIAANVNLDFANITKIKVPTGNSNGWKTMGVAGDLAYAKGQRQEMDADHLFLSVQGDDGAPISFWNNNANTDMAFTLLNNTTTMTYEVGGKVIGNFKGLNGTWGIAVNNANVKKVNVNGVGPGSVSSASGNVTDTIYLPIKGPQATRALGLGWQLVSPQADMTESQFGDTFTALVCAGNGDKSTSWFKGESNNSLHQFSKGQACFGYTEKANKAFK